MDRDRVVRVAGYAVLATFLVVATLAVVLVVADHRAGTSVTCDVVAFLTEDPAGAAVDLPPSLLDAYPELREAIAEIDPPQGGVADLACDRVEPLRNHLEALGAPDSASGDYLMRHEGRPYRVTVSIAVA